MTHTDGMLEAAAHHVTYEWLTLAQLARLLVDLEGGDRTLAHNAAVEAFMLHDRCLINFLCGNYKGGRMDGRDIAPSDFLGFEWVLEDEEMDRRLRGRLPGINTCLAHLTWDRVEGGAPFSWPPLFLAWETTWAMRQFVTAVRESGGKCLFQFEAAAAQVAQQLPPFRDEYQTTPPYAPPRRS